VDDAVATPESPERPSPPRRPGEGSIAALVSAVLAGVGSLYACTHSVLVTGIAAVTVIALVAMMLLTRR